MELSQILLVLIGALAGGIVNGLTGFGTGITAMGLWLYAVPPKVAASLVVICSFVSQVQTLPLVWRSIDWRGLLPYVVPGLLGIPLGTLLLPHVDQRVFKIGIGAFLIFYTTFALTRGSLLRIRRDHLVLDGLVGLGGGILAGLAGLSGVLPIIWTDLRGFAKEHRRSILQGFNISMLTAALAAHAASGLLTREVGIATLAALPGTLVGARIGAWCYARLGDKGFQRAVLLLLMASGAILILTSW